MSPYKIEEEKSPAPDLLIDGNADLTQHMNENKEENF